MGDRNGEALKDLADQRRDLRKQRDDNNRMTRNEERKRARLLERARNLSNEDLLAILGARAAAKAKPKAKAAAKGKAKAKAKAGAAPAGGG